MTKIILCALSDQVHKEGAVHTMTVKRSPGLPSLNMLAPTAALVYGYKRYHGDIRFSSYPEVSDEQYVAGYRTLILTRMAHIERWYKSLPPTNEQSITLCCYCRQGVFCHRQLVYKLLLWLNRKLELAHHVELY